jgi:hypothetical protein
LTVKHATDILISGQVLRIRRVEMNPMVRVNWKGTVVSINDFLISKIGHELINWEDGRRISPEVREKIRMDLSLGFSLSKVARRNRVHYETVQNVLHEYPDDVSEYRRRKREMLIDKIWDLAELVLEHITPEKMEKANLKTLVRVLATLIDKAKLLQGNPVEAIYPYVSHEELIKLSIQAGIPLPERIMKRLGLESPQEEISKPNNLN